MSWHVVNLATDHTQSVQAIVKDYVSSNWSLTGDLAAATTLFSTGWYDKQQQFQIHFRHDIDKFAKKITIGSRPMMQFPDLVLAHCFAEEQADNAEHLNIDKMNREIQRIIGSDATGLETAQGFCDLWIDSTPRMLKAESSDSQSTVHHSVIRIGCVYRKVYS